MFFPRLRRHAKWMFVFLAVALGGGFVLFGVGAGGTGVGDILRGGGGSSGVPSISSAQKKTEENPKDVRGLARAVDRAPDGRPDRRGDRRPEARSSCWRPKDTDALRELAGLYLAQATAKQQEAQQAQIRAAYQGVGPGLPRRCCHVPNGQSLLDDRSAPRSTTQDSATIQTLAGAAQAASAEAVDAYKRIVVLQPEGSERPARARAGGPAGRRYGDGDRAYTAFLKLAPDDPNASIVKQQLKQLKQTSATSG